MDQLNFIIPELFLISSIMILLMIGVFYNNSFNLIYKLSVIILLATFILLFNHSIDTSIKLFNNSYAIDYFSLFMKALTLIACIFVMLSSFDYIKWIGINKIEYPILILSATLGMMIMISSYDLIVFYMGLELQSLSLYVLASFNRDNYRSSEAGLKYFVLGALSSGLLLYGCSLIYGFSGSTNFDLIAQNMDQLNTGSIFGIVFILVGLTFKVSAVPFHMWAPDVYEGSPTSVTTFLAIVPKVAALTVFIRFLYVPFFNVIGQWQMIIIFISLASMIFGAVTAIGQTNIKRLMAYSSIGHMGYALAGLATASNVGIQGTVIYLSIYLLMNLGIFSCIFMMRRKNIFYEDIQDLSGLSKNHPVISFCLLVLLFSLAGIPPLAGFFAKFYIFMAVIEAEMYTLAIMGLITTVISAFYYLRIIKIIYFDESKEKFEIDQNFGLRISLALSTIIILVYFIYPSLLIDVVSNINLI
ncbi:MAG: NADH-quinone oxidoreductase subunit NuoN [Candidatus Pelagibacter sp.]|jgi:NADH-quinone oxidoreductase subunit N|nr:NADH-quinone oxidoreductase subunit NuoN [Candidatus Pelagibacter sp.]MDP6440205.1 NADH-quinone oxidoreductase subunit NuoN [Pelagibacteraceae bacterium]|tara:strand:+ start:12657 stop:14072 length:1416 start_codon:yes stop_codon:yes gene_type:complete